MPITTQELTLKAAGHDVPAYAASPEGRPDAPGVVVIHEIWGVDRHIRSVVDRLAEAGYAAIAPNLLGMEVTLPKEVFFAGFQAIQTIPPEERAVPARIDAAMEAVDPTYRDQFKQLMAVVSKGATPEAMAGIQACLDELKAHGASKTAVMGFCLGGAYTWAFAFQGGEADAFAPFYGRLPADYDASKVRGPVEGHFGAEDHGIPVAPLEDAMKAIRDAGRHAELFVYEGAPHAFFNETRDTYHEAAAKLAWQRILDFYGKSLA